MFELNHFTERKASGFVNKELTNKMKIKKFPLNFLIINDFFDG